MGSVTVQLDDDISVCDSADYSLKSGDVLVEITADGWWKLIESLQDWLGECPHCGRKVGEPAAPPAEVAGDGAAIRNGPPAPLGRAKTPSPQESPNDA